MIIARAPFRVSFAGGGSDLRDFYSRNGQIDRGGFFFFYCDSKYQNDVRKTLNLRELKFKFDNEGSKIVYMDR